MPDLNPFRRRQTGSATPKPVAPRTAPRTTSGRGQHYGYVVPDDHNYNLVGAQGALEFDRVWRADADARKIIRMAVNALCGGTITIEPAGGKDATPEDRAVAEFVDWALNEAMTPRLQTHLHTALTIALRNGRAPFETWYRQAVAPDGRERWVIDGLGVILPRTVTQWHTAARRLTGITQSTPENGDTLIPAENLVLYRVGDEGDNWEGDSLLRAAYRNILMKQDLEVIDAQGHERFNLGIPVAYPPEGVADRDLDEVAAALADLRAGANSYLVAPGPHQEHAEPGRGWLFDILVPKGTTNRSVIESVNHHRSAIAASVIQEFMRLGMEQVGARATADVQQDPWLQMAETLAGALVEDPINEQLIPRLVDLNFTVARYPRVSVSLIDSTSLQELGQYVGGLVSAGVVHADDVLEDYFRDRADLPPADAASRREREQATNDTAASGTTTDDDPAEAEGDGGQRLSLARQDRVLRDWEALMSLDRIETGLDTARDMVPVNLQPDIRTVAAALAAGDPAPTDAVASMRDVFHAALTDLYTRGRTTVEDELIAQGATLMGLQALADAANDHDFALRSEIAVTNIIAEMTIDAGRARMRTHPLARDTERVAAIARAAEQAGARAARKEAIANASAALGEGRRDTANEHRAVIRGARYTSILDGRRCRVCAADDDDVLRPLDDPIRLQRIPPNPDCEGGPACRCMEFFELLDPSAG